MVDVNIWALITLLVQAVMYLLIKEIKGVGKLRGASISGWLASLVGLSALLTSETIVLELEYVFGYVFIAIIGIIISFAGISNPRLYKMKVVRHIVEWYPKVGIAMGVIFAGLAQILNP